MCVKIRDGKIAVFEFFRIGLKSWEDDCDSEHAR